MKTRRHRRSRTPSAMSHAAIARVMGITPQGVQYLEKTALQKLRRSGKAEELRELVRTVQQLRPHPMVYPDWNIDNRTEDYSPKLGKRGGK